MLKNSDLQVNNIISSGTIFKDTSIIGKVLSIGNDEQEFEQIYCECSESFDWFFRDNYCGVPIQGEYLEKVGFERAILGYLKKIKVTYSLWEICRIN